MLATTGLDPNRAMSVATRDYGYGVTKDSSPQDQVNHVNTDPIAMTTEEAAHRAKHPMTPGERRFTYRHGGALAPDVLKLQQDNWDTNLVVTASNLLDLKGGFRREELAHQVEDGLFFLRALANKEPWADAILVKTIRDFPGLSETQLERLFFLVKLAQTDPDALLEFEGIKGHLSAIAWLEESGWEHDSGDIWVNRDVTGDSGVASLMGSGYYNVCFFKIKCL